MEKFVDKFNIFDIFAMLIPGIIISSLFGITLSFKYYNIWKSLGNEKYFLFFAFSYMCGVIFHEIGTLSNRLFLDKILYGGNPKEVYLSDNIGNRFHKVFKDKLSYKDALRIAKDLKKHVEIDVSDEINEKELNSILFAYCLNVCELKGLSSKADKMLVVSEMSTSLFLGCIATCILNLVMMWKFSFHTTVLHFETIFLLLSSLILILRKKRYERYRIEILLRAYSIYTREMQESKEKDGSNKNFQHWSDMEIRIHFALTGSERNTAEEINLKPGQPHTESN